MEALFIGVDVGTQGVRVVLSNEQGKVISSQSSTLPLSAQSREEQSPQQWWAMARGLLKAVLYEPHITDSIRRRVLAVSVTSTSGTVIPLDKHNEPLHDALMYSDQRSVLAAGYTRFNAYSGLAKIQWFTDNFAEKAAKINTWVHAADYLTGKLCGNYRVTDYTNALKTGYDVETYAWPEDLCSLGGLDRSWFQEVVPSGTPVGTLIPSLALELGIPEIQVVVGLTDGCASQIAAGAITPGSWNTTIGTTLVIKGVTIHKIQDPEGRIYSHRHPDGFWMPGGASNTGADWVNNGFSDHLDALNEASATLIPTGISAWPLQQKGERFPFINPEARGFAPVGLKQPLLFTANMEGVAYIERMAYSLIHSLSGEQPAAIYTAGGASHSDVWLRIRSSVLNLPIHKCIEASGAAGASISAASKTYFKTVAEAAKSMTHIEKTIFPDPSLVQAYVHGYHMFREVLTSKNYI